MTNDEIRRVLYDVLSDHDHALAAIHDASRTLHEASTAWGRALKSHDDALVHAIEIHGAALRLLAQLTNGKD